MQNGSGRTRRKRLIGWLCVIVGLVGIYAAYRLILADKVRAEFQAIRDAGYPATLEELERWYDDPPPGQNAADIYLKAFDAFEAVPRGTQSLLPRAYHTEEERAYELLPIVGESEMPGRSEPLAEETKDAIDWYMAEAEEAQRLRHEAATFEQCRFPQDYGDPVELLMPALDHSQAARLLALEMVWHAENGRPAEAAQAAQAALKLADSLSEMPGFGPARVRLACDATALQLMQRALSRTQFSDGQL